MLRAFLGSPADAVGALTSGAPVADGWTGGHAEVGPGADVHKQQALATRGLPVDATFAFVIEKAAPGEIAAQHTSHASHQSHHSHHSHYSSR